MQKIDPSKIPDKTAMRSSGINLHICSGLTNDGKPIKQLEAMHR